MYLLLTGKMKNNVTGMEEEMKRLSENIEKISTCSDQINNTLKDRRDKINHLSGIHRLLMKVIAGMHDVMIP